MGCRRESPSSSVLDAFAFPSTIIGFKLDNLLISRLQPLGTRSNTLRHCACGTVDPTPSDFRREPFPFKTIQGGQRGKRRCDRSSYLRDGPVGTGQYRVRTARTRLGMGMPSNITREDNQWHRIFRLPSQGEA